MNYTEYLNAKIGGDKDKIELFEMLFKSVQDISNHLDISQGHTGETNATGDQQLAMDVQTDIIMQDNLSQCACVAQIVSEEQDLAIHLNGKDYCVVFDPLDGSSLIDANLSIGTIIGVFEGETVVGRIGDEMIAAMIAVYGPRTTIMLTLGDGVDEFILKDGDFELKKEKITIADTSKYFAPGNLKASATEPWYRELINYWLDKQYKLRYSGGMVPDVNHILIKGGGVFTYPGNIEVPEGKLRLVYECNPMAMIIEQAGGCALDGEQRILEKKIESLHQRTPIYIGSCEEVKKVVEFWQEGKK